METGRKNRSSAGVFQHPVGNIENGIRTGFSQLAKAAGIGFLTGIGLLMGGIFLFQPCCKSPMEKPQVGTLNNDDFTIGGGTGGGGCVKPYSGMIIEKNTMLCKGEYNLPSHNSLHGAIIINTSGVILDLNGATLTGDRSCHNRADTHDTNALVGILINHASGLTIKNGRIQNYCIGVHSQGGTDVSVVDNIFLDNSSSSPGWGDNIQFLYTNRSTIKGNKIKGGLNEGIYLDNSCNELSIEDNFIESVGAHGINCATAGCSRVVVKNNTISKTARNGINFDNSKEILIEGNKVSNSGKSGIYLNYVTNSKIAGNTIVDSSYLHFGIEFENALSSGNIISNNYLNNLSNVLDEGLNNFWNTQVDCSHTNILGGKCVGGNYYSDYNGTDVDGDGIGDLPYKIPGSAKSVDSFPLVN